MKGRLSILTLVLAALLVSHRIAPASAEAHGAGIAWQKWDEGVFDRARAQKRLVVLDLEAVWCHWCHVMHEQTYANPTVSKLMTDKFVAVKADQDAEPALSARYRDYGWPATIIFDGNGRELRKLSGFVEPADFEATLRAVLAKPEPDFEADKERAVPAQVSALPEALKTELIGRHRKAIDTDVGGLRTAHRYLDATSIEYALSRKEKEDRAWAFKTLDANLALLDPAWGGLYQYSTRRGWTNPHFEKIMSTQATGIVSYALAYAQTGEARYREAAEKIASYLRTFLKSEEGAFFTSQDADLVPGQHSPDYFKLDDMGRRAQGMPRIDKNIYASENGLAIEAFAWLYGFTGAESILGEAKTAALWIEKNRRLPAGGFAHGTTGPYLADSLAMGRAFLALYAVTGERDFLQKARAEAAFIDATFAKAEEGGYFSAPPATVKISVRRLEENVSLARFANMLFHYTGDAKYRAIAERAFAYASIGEVVTRTITEAGVLLAGEELANEPAHVTIIGPKGDALAKELFMTALSVPLGYRRIEWWDRSEGAMPNPDVSYPKLPKPAAFVCAKKRCSLAILTVEELRDQLKPLAPAAL